MNRELYESLGKDNDQFTSNSRKIDGPGNPQGKGRNGTLSLLKEAEISSSLPDLHSDGLERIVEDYLATLLIVSCKFKFRPVSGVPYYLYVKDGSLLLSLVSPGEGGRRLYDEFVASCRLKDDLSWTIQRAEPERFIRLCTDGVPIEVQRLQGKRKQGVERLRTLLEEIDNSENWQFDSRLGYYQNVMLFLVQKTLRYRLNRLRDHGLHLDQDERKLLLSL